MHSSLVLLSGLALLASAAPTNPTISTDVASSDRSLDIVSSYFNLVAAKVSAYKHHVTPITCDLSSVQLPSGMLLQ